MILIAKDHCQHDLFTYRPEIALRFHQRLINFTAGDGLLRICDITNVEIVTFDAFWHRTVIHFEQVIGYRRTANSKSVLSGQ